MADMDYWTGGFILLAGICLGVVISKPRWKKIANA